MFSDVSDRLDGLKTVTFYGIRSISRGRRHSIVRDLCIKSEIFLFVEVFQRPFKFYDGVNRVDVNVFRYSEFLNLDFPRSVLGLVFEILKFLNNVSRSINVWI